MRSTRTTSFKSKFKNTQETMLNLDEGDDDFIAPPIEPHPEPVNVDTTRQTNLRRNYRTRSTPMKENISSQPTDVNKDKEETIPSDNTVVGRMKRKGFARSTPVKDSKISSEASGERKKPRSLNELLMESMSRSKKNNEKAKFGVEMEDKENVVKRKKIVNDAHSKKSPKRKKGKIGNENVNTKTMEGKVRKVSKNHPEGYRRLETRMTPGRISATVKVMSPAQKNGIVSMGFGSLLNIDMDTTLGLLKYYLLDHYDPDSSCLVLENMVITTTKDTVHDMLGLPNVGEDFLSVISCEKDNEVLQEWKSQYDKKGFNVEEYI
ncbi:unnamed protein product [Lactuca saligna]|uniref:Uncharacterized protein n=1 Tax=Lactuca saligna TaxID=75948 RepID=A0AA35ZL89_LACSI|nr:unnamed protein product [Lactuca saligna]